MSVRSGAPSYQRLGRGEIFGRSIVAAVSGSLMCVGAYPMLPALIVAKRRRQSLIGRALSRDVLVDWALGVASTVVRPLGFAGLPGGRVRGARPVILAHGYAMGRSCFLPMAARLGARGIGPIVGFEYWTLGSVAASARRLGRVIDRVLADTGAEQVDIVGHSMGGIVARYFVSLEGGDDRVRRLITLGSPHKGSEFQFIGAGQMRRELAPGSPTLTRLAAAPRPKTEMTLIYSPVDVLAGGSRHTKVEGAEVIRFDNIGHMGLLTHGGVFDVVRERLGG